MHGSANLKKVVKKDRCTRVGTVGHVMLVIVYTWYCWLVAFQDINQFVLIIMIPLYIILLLHCK